MSYLSFWSIIPGRIYGLMQVKNAGNRGLRARDLFVNDGNLAEDQSRKEHQDFSYDPNRDFVNKYITRMLHIALEALSQL